jgi:hypothetical protein
MRRLGTPLRRILKEDVASKVAIQSLHLCPKPNSQNQKALDMSSLMKDHVMDIQEIIMDASLFYERILASRHTLI